MKIPDSKALPDRIGGNLVRMGEFTTRRGLFTRIAELAGVEEGLHLPVARVEATHEADGEETALEGLLGLHDLAGEALRHRVGVARVGEPGVVFQQTHPGRGYEAHLGGELAGLLAAVGELVGEGPVEEDHRLADRLRAPWTALTIESRRSAAQCSTRARSRAKSVRCSIPAPGRTALFAGSATRRWRSNSS